jgi:hypothetical protein
MWSGRSAAQERSVILSGGLLGENEVLEGKDFQHVLNSDKAG